MAITGHPLGRHWLVSGYLNDLHPYASPNGKRQSGCSGE